MDKFGYIRGQRGPPGPRGRDAFNIFTWIPFSGLRMFRENEACTFYFNTVDDGILYDENKKPVGLKDRGQIKWKSDIRNALCLQNFLKPVRLKSGYYGIFLKNSLYKISGLPTVAETRPSIMIIAFSFKVSGILTDEDDYICTNKNNSRGVTISRNSLNILGSQAQLELEYEVDDWNTMIIQYSCIAEGGNDKCIFTLNGIRGFFNLRIDKTEERDLYIGGHPDKRNYGNVTLGNFEVYTRIFDIEAIPLHYVIPNELIQVLEDDMDERTGQNL